MAALLQARKIRVDALEILLYRPLVLAHIGAQAQVFFGGEIDESAAAVRNMGDAQAHDVLGRAAVDARAAETDLTRGLHHGAERAQRSRLAGAVGAEQRGDRAVLEDKVDAVEHPRRP